MSLSIITFLGCSGQKRVSQEEYITWVNNAENGLVQEQVVGDYKFSFQYLPAEYMALKELMASEIMPTKPVFDSVLNNYRGLQYGVMKIGALIEGGDVLKQSITSEAEYFERIQYYTTIVPRDIFIVKGNDTLNCAMHHFERTFSISSFNTIMLGFENNSDSNDQIVVYDDQVLGTGKISFFISREALSNIPLIEF
ncbi:MAG: hypothetical protein V4651_05155 [Bacteroidota bacterium]